MIDSIFPPQCVEIDVAKMNLLFRGVLLVSLLSLSVSAFNSTSTRQKRESTWEENSPYRLSDASFPIHYDLYLKTNVHNEGDRAFSGHVNILVEFRETTDHLKLNTGQIDIKLASISDFEGNLLIANAPTNFGDDFLTVNFLYEFQAGSQYFINIEFQADLRLDGTGFYRSSYEDSSGDTVWYASTNVSIIYQYCFEIKKIIFIPPIFYYKFKPIKARQTFPCYDEPGYRTTFNIEIEHHNSYSALSNMPQESILPVEGSDNVITKFQTTPVMQTHMVAYTISKFGNPIENVSAAPSLNIYTIPSKYYETRFAASHSRKAMDAIENYLKFPYALEKMDQVYLPNMGGSENFGLINYQEPYFLYDEKIHPISRKMNVARLICKYQ